jgi:tRNA-dihydrouridine synthase B
MKYKIGDVQLDNNLVLAPMAGITDIAFRIICKQYGAGLVYTEMVNANAIYRNNKSTLKKAKICEEERPAVIQLFGARKKELIESAKILEAMGADIIDFNLGCPDRNVIKQGAGSALLKRPAKIKELISALVDAVDIPVTAKIRIGITKGQNFGLKTAKIIEEAGASAIAVHGRTVDQAYSGKADWNAIKEIKENISIPVIGSGDVATPEDAERMIKETGCDFIMIGRAAIANPHIFREILDTRAGKKSEKLTAEQKIQLVFEYSELAKKMDCFDFVSLRQHACDFTKGLHEATRLRLKISQAKSEEELGEILKNAI